MKKLQAGSIRGIAIRAGLAALGAVLLSIWLFFEFGGTDRRPAAEAAPLNVVVIIVDTLRRDHVGSYGYERNTTPHVDEFFRNGTTFLNATSPSPCTVPAVLQLLTGARDFDVRRPRLAETLRDAGFATAAIVSQHHFRTASHPRPEYTRGFDEFDIQEAHERDHHRMTSRNAAEVSDRAIAWLNDRTSDAPFFLWLHYFDPHDPYEPPEDSRIFPAPAPDLDGDRRRHLLTAMKKALRSADEETRKAILSKPNPYTHFGEIYSVDQVSTLRSYYDGEVLYTDAQIGRVFDALDRNHLLDRTFVALTSDHGERLGEGNRWAHCQSLHGYEVNVPLLIHHPRKDAEHRVSSAVSTLDIVPTVLSALGIQYDRSDLDGGDVYAPEEDRMIYSLWEREQAIQNGDWKLVTGIGEGVGDANLYHLAVDPDERNDLSERYPERVEKMRRLMHLEARAASDEPPRIDETLERLRAIGYVQ
jgi:arylsulfatase